MAKKKKQTSLPTPRKIAIASIITLAFAFTIFIICQIIFTPIFFASRELEHIARDYYENYYHAKFIANKSGLEAEAAFAPYTESGFPTLTLRQLLLFDNSRHAASAPTFTIDGQPCSTSDTTIRIYPQPPFGPKNYRLETHLSCP